MIKLSNQKTYSIVVGSILFTLGFFGLAFNSSFDVPSRYLVGSLILGFWGIVVASSRQHPTA